MPETIQLFLKRKEGCQNEKGVASGRRVYEDCTTQNISAVTGHIPLSQGDQVALWSMVCKGGDHLNDGEKELLFHLLMEYAADVFAFNSGQIGRTSILKHRIDTTPLLSIFCLDESLRLVEKKWQSW